MAVRPAGSADQEGSLTQRAAYGAGHIQIHNGIAYFSALHAPDLASADAHTVGGQTRQVVRLLEAKLQQHGCSKEQLLTVTVTLKDMPGAEQAFGESWGSWTDMPATHILVGACGKDVLVAISGAFCLPPAK
ncbi:hypothetical protein WJX72_002808 [[Myrmecia] bisecta]|uniref:Uncharacterized protein n=1 Tax=[Myrmecia] bisecta TaxID=41462 RepID=A0AAW1QPM8_9CHLO